MDRASVLLVLDPQAGDLAPPPARSSAAQHAARQQAVAAPAALAASAQPQPQPHACRQHLLCMQEVLHMLGRLAVPPERAQVAAHLARLGFLVRR
jgi:hypothetical protein